MPELRPALASRVERLVGRDILRITDVGTGWPAFADLLLDGSEVSVSLYVASISSGGRPDRTAIERRFQNVASKEPITRFPGRSSLLLGAWFEDHEYDVERPVLVLADAERRMDKRTRWPVFVPVAALREADATGWSSALNASNEVLRCFDATLLPIAVQAALLPEALTEDRSLQHAIQGAGLDEQGTQVDAERARRSAQVLIRDWRFSALVRQAYDGRCAMCGLGLGMVQGAHLYPASAPGSLDVVSNGLSLCPNHHVAFDRYLIFVGPDTLDIVLHPDFYEAPGEAAYQLTKTTFGSLSTPDWRLHRPSSAMLAARYDYYRDRYRWVPPELL